MLLSEIAIFVPNSGFSFLDPPSIKSMTTHDVLEGDLLSLDCPATEGNPTDTMYGWKRSSDNEQWLTRTLTLRVHRTDDAVYTCTASNVMTPTGFEPVLGYANGTVHLNVQCKYNVCIYSIQGISISTSK